MPRLVDHSDRRDLVTEVAAELIATQGIEALTVRSVAAAAGFSTAVVSHYFADKRDLLRSTFRAAADRSTIRFTQAVQGPDRTLASCLESLLPLTSPARRDWLLFLAFWGIAAADEELAAEQRDRVRSARARIGEVLLVELPEVSRTSDLDESASALLTLVQGIASQAVFDPEYWTPQRQSDQLRRGMHLIVADIGAGQAVA